MVACLEGVLAYPAKAIFISPKRPPADGFPSRQCWVYFWMVTNFSLTGDAPPKGAFLLSKYEGYNGGGKMVQVITSGIISQSGQTSSKDTIMNP
jgi:hypothetical protein